VLIDPCVEPESIVIGVPTSSDSDYSHPAIFTFPSTSVYPEACITEAVYTCGFVSGPNVNIDIDFDLDFDMCGCDFWNGDYHSVITFNVQTGDLEFNTDDFVLFPPGTYTFEITI
jgi:hypothetical protein